jgi:hypothetical protein
MLKTNKAFFLVLSIFLSTSCSFESNQSKVNSELILGCKEIQSDFGMKVDKATPYFANAARLDSSYLVLIDKIAESVNTGLGDSYFRSLQAKLWLANFCEGLDR